jgi:murein DD-endopeptidase MepM/ murein hydrolase activator NlpD
MKNTITCLLIIFPLWCNSQGFNTVTRNKILPTITIDNKETILKETHEIKEETFNSTTENIITKNVSFPLTNIQINSQYGERKDPFSGRKSIHYGIDLKAQKDSVMSILPGKITKAGNDKRLGNYVEVDHGELKSVYGHLSRIIVEKGDSINAGEVLGISGNTGRSTGEHLHFGIKHLNKWVNPLPILDYFNSILL